MSDGMVVISKEELATRLFNECLGFGGMEPRLAQELTTLVVGALPTLDMAAKYQKYLDANWPCRVCGGHREHVGGES